MSVAEIIEYTEKGLAFFGLTHKHIDNLVFILILFAIFFFAKKWYTLGVACKDVNCEKAKAAIKKVESMEAKISEIEILTREARVEYNATHESLKTDLERFEKYLSDLKGSTAELHGILVGSATIRDRHSRRSIIHDD